jgi:ribosomal protein L18E
MKGVNYLTDDQNRRTAVVIDIKTIEKHPEDVEDLIDILVAESRRNEPKRIWSEVKKKLTSRKRNSHK